jgi:hypothetical protein
MFSETLVPTYQATRCHNPDDHCRNFHRRGYLKSNTEKWHLPGWQRVRSTRHYVYRGRDSKVTAIFSPLSLFLKTSVGLCDTVLSVFVGVRMCAPPPPPH